MPINDPVNNRKIAPGSLAFERRRQTFGTYYAGEDTDGDVYNYQYYIEVNFNTTVNNIVNKQYLFGETNKVMKSIGNAEHRSKHWVGDYKRSFQWDITTDIDYVIDDWNVIPYNNEILSSMGAHYTGSYGNNPNWEFICPSDAAGVWWVKAYHQIRFQSGKGIREARLGVFVNGVLWREIDGIDQNMMGENNIRDCHLMGSVHVPLTAGDYLQIKFKPVNLAGGTGTSLYPSSLYSYVTAHRENCEINYTNNGLSKGSLYSFDHTTP